MILPSPCPKSYWCSFSFVWLRLIALSLHALCASVLPSSHFSFSVDSPNFSPLFHSSTLSFLLHLTPPTHLDQPLTMLSIAVCYVRVKQYLELWGPNPQLGIPGTPVIQITLNNAAKLSMSEQVSVSVTGQWDFALLQLHVCKSLAWC